MSRIHDLGWALLELKLAYYHPTQIHPSWKEVFQEDRVYDELENEYKKLCAEQGVEPTACTMVGFSFDRPACRLVAGKLVQPKGDNESVLSYVIRRKK